MQISKAKIREENGRLVIDAVVDGKLLDGFVLYDGVTISHELAALEYLTNAGVAFQNISLETQTEMVEVAA